MAPLFGHQRRTALALQLFKLGADGRSGTRQAQRCCLGETAALHAGHKAAQGVEIQPRVSVSPSLSPFSGRLS